MDDSHVGKILFVFESVEARMRGLVEITAKELARGYGSCAEFRRGDLRALVCVGVGIPADHLVYGCAAQCIVV